MIPAGAVCERGNEAISAGIRQQIIRATGAHLTPHQFGAICVSTHCERACQSHGLEKLYTNHAFTALHNVARILLTSG